MDADVIQWLKKARENLDISLLAKPREHYNSICISSRDSSSRDSYTNLISSADDHITVQAFQHNFNLCFLPLPCNTAHYFFSAFYIPLPWSNSSRTQQLHTQNTSTLLTESNSLSHPRGLILLIQLERLPQSAGTRALMHQTSQHCSLPYSHLPLSSSSAATFQQHSNRHICWSLLNCTEYLCYTPHSASWCTEVHHSYTSASESLSGVRRVYWDIYGVLHIDCCLKINQGNSECWIIGVWHYTHATAPVAFTHVPSNNHSKVRQVEL